MFCPKKRQKQNSGPPPHHLFSCLILPEGFQSLCLLDPITQITILHQNTKCNRVCFASSNSEHSICCVCTTSRSAFLMSSSHKAEIKTRWCLLVDRYNWTTRPLNCYITAPLRRPPAVPRGSGVECERVSWSLCSGQRIVFSGAKEPARIVCHVSKMILPRKTGSVYCQD